MLEITTNYWAGDGVRLVLLLCLRCCCPMKWGLRPPGDLGNMMPTSVGILAAFKSWSISRALVMGELLADRSPRSFQMAAYKCMMWKAHLESLVCCHRWPFALSLAARVSALASAISTAFWEEVPKGRGWDSIISVSETMAHPATFSPSDVIEELPSIYQVKSGLFKGVEKMWETWGIRSPNASLQVWMGGSEELGIRMAGLRVGQSLKENSGDSRRVSWISWMREGDRGSRICEKILKVMWWTNDSGCSKSQGFTFLSEECSCCQST